MPFKTAERLNKLIQQALTDADITKGITETDNIRNEDVAKHVLDNQEEVWKHAISAMQEYDKLEPEVERIKTTNKDALDGGTNAINKLTQTLETIYVWIFFMSVILVITAYVNFNAQRWIATLKSFYVAAPLFILVMLIIAANVYVARRKKMRSSFSENREKVLKDTQLDVLEGQLAAIIERAEFSLLDKVKEQTIVAINKFKDKSFSIYLDNINTPGLSQVINASKTINTKAKANLDFLFNNMSGGSIGIAGPRGAGKSTLIQSYCGPGRTIGQIKNKSVLPVLTSAPVQYEPRDFILHLYASTCQSVKDILDSSAEGKEDTEEDTLITSNKQELNEFLGKIATSSFLIGWFLLALGIVIIICNRPRIFLELPDINIFKVIGIEHGPVLRWGLLLIGVSVFLFNVAGLQVKNIPAVKKLLANIPTIKKIFSKKDKTPEPVKKIEPVAKHHLVIKANKALKEIKFQQSFTSGWSGALKSPIGLETSMNTATTISEKQKTNPEIVSEFTDFLKKISAEFQVIIGIDELDKISSDEQAQKFLNEIKSIFGLQDCFYLISVSENAMSNFERRGLPFRDVFDSSFDCLVHVDYFDLNESISLLQGRVIGKPMQFFYLSYCMSGGLPRDLIRAFRQIVEIRRGLEQNNDLSTITAQLIRAEILGKVRATNYLLKKQQNIPETDSFFSLLYTLQNNIASASTGPDSILSSIISAFLAEIDTWQKDTLKAKEKNIAVAGMADAYDAIMQYSEELYIYSSLMLTLLEFFNNGLDEARVNSISPVAYKDLAQAKQFMAIDSVISRSIIRQFRNTYALMPLG